MDKKINSKEYWDDRFASGDWEEKGGTKQTEYFYNLLLNMLPKDIKEDFEKNKLTICDVGCAEGDGTNTLKDAFKNSTVNGVDISEAAVDIAKKNYPDIEFSTKLDKQYNVIVSSNTLEHFEKPSIHLKQLFLHSKNYVVILVPFEEYDRIKEHFFTFTYAFFKLQYQNFGSYYIKEIESDKRVWNGKQLLLVFKKDILFQDITLDSLGIAELLYSRDKMIKKQKELLIKKEELISNFEILVSEKEQKNEIQKQKLLEKEQQLKQQQKILLDNDNIIESKNQELNSIYNSNFWKIASKYYALKEKSYMIPFIKIGRNLKRHGVIKTSKKIKLYASKGNSYYKRHGFTSFIKRVKEKIASIPTVGSKLNFNPYNFIQLRKPIKFLRFEAKETIKIIFDFTVVVPVYNEEDNILKTLDSFSKQTILPGEIIIVDGGSTDKTVDMIKNYQINNKQIKIILLETDYRNIGKQRNKGIMVSKNEIISLCDTGCIYDTNYFSNVVSYFSDNNNVDLVAAKYIAYSNNVIGNEFIPSWTELDLDEYLPGGASMTIRKSIAVACGLFPEYLQNTGEDTYFSFMYRRKSDIWIFSDNSLLYWEIPKNKQEAKEKKEKYGYGDGLNGLGCYLYPHRYNLSIDDLYGNGIKNGYEKRASVEINERRIKGVVIILSGVPMTDSGGGQRGAQLACEFTKRNYKVFFVNFYPSYEKESKIFFDIDYSLLELFSFEDFDAMKIFEKYLDVMKTSYIISEIPHIDFLHIFEATTKLSIKPTLVYDYIDNWNSSLGGEWYSIDIEEKFFDISNKLIASANSLQEELQIKSKRDVKLVPNAVNTTLFNPEISYERPNDLPKNNLPIALYIGAMWGEWFDWELIDYCVKTLTSVNFVFIGEAPKDKIDFLESYSHVHFLGLKKQFELPAYLSYSDCTIIPFKNDNIVKYVNPLKIYEYLSMTKPVVGMYYSEISNIPGVFLGKTYEEFSMLLKQLLKENSHFHKKDVYEFIIKNNWKSRVDTILDLNSPDKNSLEK